MTRAAHEDFAPTQPMGLDLLPPLAPSEALSGRFDVVHADPAARAAAHRASDAQVRQGFRIGDIGLMIRYEHGSELTEMPQVFRMPNAPEWFVGVSNLHGALTPVFDLAGYAGATGTPDAQRMLLVLMHGTDAAGIVIDGLPQRLRFAAADTTDARTAPPSLAPHVRAAALIEGQWWFDLDPSSLLDALEQALAGRH